MDDPYSQKPQARHQKIGRLCIVVTCLYVLYLGELPLSTTRPLLRLEYLMAFRRKNGDMSSHFDVQLVICISGLEFPREAFTK
jgi:hypothetical protein